MFLFLLYLSPTPTVGPRILQAEGRGNQEKQRQRAIDTIVSYVARCQGPLCEGSKCFTPGSLLGAYNRVTGSLLGYVRGFGFCSLVVRFLRVQVSKQYIPSSVFFLIRTGLS